ncbi:F420-0:Gamma-glutamyl ligase [Synechococcus sp. BSF8S]|uniref:F420-0:Gamma-glutamyl ligase n=1 Tax=Synechococcales TaxID=1890424 RepID=UPI001626CD3F|nr:MULTISPECIES: F420-0:Gamma-glutamyl ligase [unclassified Synechococcus]MBC1261134.1 F420-0:Gamma-glutamyl ligase [Synechococcus sp. BSF8S]MBC1264037.1 F420-0:Gamma-glutamyl ligase [Synechococcus sp. BSA11S]
MPSLPPTLCALILLALLFGLTLLWLELRHRLRPASPLRLSSGPWSTRWTDEGSVTFEGTLRIDNPHHRMEVMVPELELRATVLGREDLSHLRVASSVVADHPDESSRPDGYWAAYIVKGHKSTQVRATVRISLAGGANAPSPEERHTLLQELLDTLWLEVVWVNYGPFGRLERRQGFLVPVRHPQPRDPATAAWRAGDGCQVLPVPTHLLGVLDDPAEVLRRYAGPVLRPGDILTIGETPLAVIQGRYQHPAMVEPSCLARLLCRVFHPTSSLATACGLQSLIDTVGPARVLCAWLAGSLMKVVGSKGGFYRLAGDQARLIDDITGTTPPYDQTIVLGPDQPERCCQELALALGVPVAVVDVNDLGRVKVLASSAGCNEDLLRRALRPNPAGNANERTPLVLVRPA